MNPNLSDGFPKEVEPWQYLHLLSAKELLILFWQTDGLPALWTGSNLVETVETQIVLTPASGNKEVGEIRLSLRWRCIKLNHFLKKFSFSSSIKCLASISPIKSAWFHRQNVNRVVKAIIFVNIDFLPPFTDLIHHRIPFDITRYQPLPNLYSRSEKSVPATVWSTKKVSKTAWFSTRL